MRQIKYTLQAQGKTCALFLSGRLQNTAIALNCPLPDLHMSLIWHFPGIQMSQTGQLHHNFSLCTKSPPHCFIMEEFPIYAMPSKPGLNPDNICLLDYVCCPTGLLHMHTDKNTAVSAMPTQNTLPTQQ